MDPIDGITVTSLAELRAPRRAAIGAVELDLRDYQQAERRAVLKSLVDYTLGRAGDPPSEAVTIAERYMENALRYPLAGLLLDFTEAGGIPDMALVVAVGAKNPGPAPPRGPDIIDGVELLADFDAPPRPAAAGLSSTAFFTWIRSPAQRSGARQSES
jgi:hypothetical protein